jgi:hypothetical protein
MENMEDSSVVQVFVLLKPTLVSQSGSAAELRV